MHLLIILLQQLLGMLPGSKKVPQPEVVRNGSANPSAGEPDACGRIAPSLCGWMTPFESFLCCANSPRVTPAAALCWVVGWALVPAARLHFSIGGPPAAVLRAHPCSPAASERRPRR
ncbi:MAG TPA: hypothetical protein VG826_24150 [Pirellulales bacterium]|nr:hypothetical protein [Pirellulales bacterium]